MGFPIIEVTLGKKNQEPKALCEDSVTVLGALYHDKSKIAALRKRKK
jgi:hypothetical protein